ncbi:hydrogenase expression/formation protein HypE [Marinobacterium iners]|uniref:Hydrogenase expression/formation protein HypE n=1 Tax=Marinobacterium iners DSM 11526 TaxID=1122198 RepID=A0A1H4D0T8_9GAMM|nr:hydrogenase expression/formation protein HypE [Marinobacterium iners]SEA65952.1 hydrogenase expression/formation protein HypE [Marinobacterium iners DSM 11526]
MSRLDLTNGKVEMAHGGGGRAMAQLISQLFARAFDNEWLAQGNDQAQLSLPAGRLAFASDSHVVSPLFFPGGDIGSLAVHGTLNDLAMCGARPHALSVGFILEEGFALAELARIVESMAQASREANVPIVTGDTKVVERGKGDGVFINTSGVGIVPEGLDLSGDRARPGDCILLSGSVGDHGACILTQRESLGFAADIRSDSCALHRLTQAMVAQVPQLRCMRDPTRGGLANTLNELAQQSGVGMQLEEAAIPVIQPVQAVCELLGLDPLYLANEGKLIAICPPEQAPMLLDLMRARPEGQAAAIIGTVTADPQQFVQLRTRFGGNRLLDWLNSEPLPRIC